MIVSDDFLSHYKQDENGYISYTPSNWDKFWGTDYSDQELNALQYNQALKQYNDQFQLQQEAFNLNKANQAFNQELATKQFGLQEESYRNGVLNQAAQLQSLGINPASMGGNISSGPSVSGGSNVGDVNAGSVAGRSPAMISNTAKQQMRLSALANLMDIATRANEHKVAMYNAKTQRMAVQSQDRKNTADIFNASRDFAETRQNNISQRDYTSALAESSRIDNEVKQGDLDYLKSIGLSRSEWNTLSELEFTRSEAESISSKLGFSGLGLSIGTGGNSRSDTTISGSTLFVLYRNLRPNFSMMDFVVSLNLSGVVSKPLDDEVPMTYQEVLQEFAERHPQYSGQEETIRMILHNAQNMNWSTSMLKEELKRMFNVEYW